MLRPVDAFCSGVDEAGNAKVGKAAALIVWTEAVEAKLAGGADFDIAAYTTACNTLRRLLADIGLERKAKDITDVSVWLRRQRERAEAQG